MAESQLLNKNEAECLLPSAPVSTDLFVLQGGLPCLGILYSSASSGRRSPLSMPHVSCLTNVEGVLW